MSVILFIGLFGKPVSHASNTFSVTTCCCLLCGTSAIELDGKPFITLNTLFSSSANVGINTITQWKEHFSCLSDDGFQYMMYLRLCQMNKNVLELILHHVIALGN